jgi:hypothetical protein
MKKVIRHNAFYFSALILLVLAGCEKKPFDAPPGEIPLDIDLTTIEQLKSLHTLDSLEYIDEELFIEGVVIADDKSGNFYKTLAIQDETGGIGVRINATNLYNDYPIGMKIYIKCKGLWLDDYNGVIQLNGGVIEDNGETVTVGIETLLLEDIIIKGKRDQPVTPKVVNINQLDASYVNTLVKLEGVQMVVGDTSKTYADAVGKFSVNLTVEDCDDNTIILRTSGYATFAGTKVASGNGSLVGVFSVFGQDKQLYIRDLTDVDLAGDRCGSGGGNTGTAFDEISESFDGVDSDQDVGIAEWTNIAVKGTRLWRGKIFDTNHYAQATAYNDSNPEMETWLITPALKLDVDKKLSFETAQAFYTHEGLTVWISTNFDGTNINAANWTQINCPIASSADGDNTWVPSGNISLAAYSGIGHIAFRYTGAGGGNTGTFRVDNVNVTFE